MKSLYVFDIMNFTLNKKKSSLFSYRDIKLVEYKEGVCILNEIAYFFPKLHDLIVDKSPTLQTLEEKIQEKFGKPIIDNVLIADNLEIIKNYLLDKLKRLSSDLEITQKTCSLYSAFSSYQLFEIAQEEKKKIENLLSQLSEEAI